MNEVSKAVSARLFAGGAKWAIASINWAQTPPGSVETSIAAGFQRHMTKPVEEELVSAIASLNASNARLTRETQ